MFSFRFRNLDFALLGGLFVLACGSLLALASVNMTFFWRQLFFFGVAFLVIFFGSQLDWRWLGGEKWFLWGIYWFSVLLLLASHFQSGTIRGTKSWIVIGNYQFEPAEFAKLALIFVLAHFFSRKHVAAWHTKNIFLSLLYTAIPGFLVLLHPDFGSAMVIFGIWLGFLIMSGVNKKRFLIGFFLGVMMLVLAWAFVLKPYQKDRLTAFIFPERDPFGVSYNVIQSKISIGSAGTFGKGFGSGTQTQLGFLPEAQTDFIFASFTEEWGFLGGLIIILTFVFIIYRLISIGLRGGDNYSKFLVLGTVFVFFIHFFINIGSNVGVMPVTGIPLPFFSYGGSNLLTVATLMSIIQRIKLESSK